MEDQINARLDELKRDFEQGQAQIHELELRQAQLRETLLRISGAIQVLEELKGQPSPVVAEEAPVAAG